MGELPHIEARPKNQLVKLTLIHLRVACFNIKELILVVIKYPRFLKEEFLFAGRYFFKSPYAISKAFLKQKGITHLYSYGETPLSIYEKIAVEARLLSSDVFFDLGCGRGKGIFWIGKQVKCRAIGIEWIPTFMNFAKKIKKENFEFRCEDLISSSFEEATVIYLYALDWEEKLLDALLDKISCLKEGTRVITVSEPLPEKSPFKLVKSFEGKFPWGKTFLYLHIRS